MSTRDLQAPWPGTYALVCRAVRLGRLSIGRLGTLEVEAGFYVYLGSAFGPGGIRARVAHHLRAGRRRHWHADYLWPALRIEEIWYSHDTARREHEWARLLRGLRAFSVPLARFGASDCRCETHLLHNQEPPSLRAFRAGIQRSIPDHGTVRRCSIC
jgi:Uri superfamily endonuclease